MAEKVIRPKPRPISLNAVRPRPERHYDEYGFEYLRSSYYNKCIIFGPSNSKLGDSKMEFTDISHWENDCCL